MKVILLENIKKLGGKYEIVEVADGYARNFLLPQDKAKIATEGVLKSLEEKKEKEKERKKKEEKKIEQTIEKLKGKKFTIKMKVGDKNQLFQSVNSKKISEKMKEEGFDISEKQIILNEPIKQLTERDVGIEFDYGAKTTVKIKIEEE